MNWPRFFGSSDRHLLPVPAALLVVCACGGSAPVPAELAITHVSVLDLQNARVLADQTVLIDGNRIVAMGPSARTPATAGARIVDGSEKYLIPGLWDMHVHSSTDRITRETLLPLYIANGITGVRDMRGDCFDPCGELGSSIEHVQQWRRDIAAGSLVGPRIIASSPMIEGPPPGQASSVEAPATEAEARETVRLLKARGVDFVKVYSWISREAYFALADEAAKQGIPFAGHVPVAVRASEVSDAGQLSIEHFPGIIHECSTREDELRELLLSAEVGDSMPSQGTLMVWMSESFSGSKCAALYDRFVRNGTWQVPTLIAQRGVAEWYDDPRLKYVSQEEKEYWEERIVADAERWPIETRSVEFERDLAITGEMQRAGVGILAGTDTGDPFVFAGFAIHEELALLVMAGLTEAEALMAATLNPARLLEATDSLGAVAVGNLADLVLLDANPLEDIRNTQRICAVIYNGRYFDRQGLDELLADVEVAVGR
jgi:hypothetical protein